MILPLAGIYRSYIACLNRHDLAHLDQFVRDDVQYNGKAIGLSGYREMLSDDFRAIPDLQFTIALLVVEDPVVASRLDFDCTPQGMLLGLPVNGRRVAFSENVFYEFRDEKIWRVWSVIDKGAIEAQLSA
ncbi:MAG: ester cyclase [Chloroflexota bacterium]|nr:ester cyclase [Chloroflexota bacterium]